MFKLLETKTYSLSYTMLTGSFSETVQNMDVASILALTESSEVSTDFLDGPSVQLTAQYAMIFGRYLHEKLTKDAPTRPRGRAQWLEVAEVKPSRASLSLAVPWVVNIFESAVVMNRDIQTVKQFVFFFAPGCKHVYFCWKVLTWALTLITLLVEQPSGGRSRSCIFLHCGRLPFGLSTHFWGFKPHNKSILHASHPSQDRQILLATSL